MSWIILARRNIFVSSLIDLSSLENFGERKGAAYGLAGLVKGLGILALKQLDIMNRLTEALQAAVQFMVVKFFGRFLVDA